MSEHPGAPATIPSPWVRLAVDALGETGFDALGFLARAGIAALDADDTRIPLSTMADLWDAAGRATNDPLVALHAAAKLPVRLRSPVAYLFTSSATLLDALTRLQQYRRLYAGDGSLTVESCDERYVLRVHGHPAYAMTPDQTEYAVGILWRSCGWASGDEARPLEVRFAHAARADLSAYRAVFGCPVAFGSAEDAIVLDAALMHRPLPHANDEIVRAMETRADQMMARLDEGPLAERVQAVVLVDLARLGGHLEAAAKRLGTGARTLQRRLTAEGTTFARVLDGARRLRSLELLTQTSLTLDTIAEQTGFSDARALARAVRRWTGRSPAALRAERRRAG